MTSKATGIHRAVQFLQLFLNNFAVSINDSENALVEIEAHLDNPTAIDLSSEAVTEEINHVQVHLIFILLLVGF